MRDLTGRVEREVIASVEAIGRVNAQVLRLRTLRGEVRARRLAAEREGRTSDAEDLRVHEHRLSEAIDQLANSGQGLAS